MLSFGGKARGVETVFLSAGQMRSFWQRTPVGGALLSEWVGKTFNGPTIESIQREVFAGMFEGLGFPGMSKRLQEGFVISKREADTLVRTYVQTANVHAMDTVYGKNRDIIAGVRWLTAFDKRTCMRCAYLGGKLYPLDNHPECPLHPRCRCVLIPETDINKLKVQPKVAEDWAKELKTRIPGLETVLTPDGIPRTDFRRWILAQSEVDQLAFFGATRYGLLKEGKITWEDLFEETLDQNGREGVRLRRIRELLGDRVVEHRARKDYGKAIEQAVAIKVEREARDLERHRAMAAKLDERAVKKILYPLTLVGVKRGKKMSYEELYRRGDTNPGYKEDLPGRRNNCQTCILATEARIRGYRDIEAQDNADDRFLREVKALGYKGRDGNAWLKAWVDPKTGKAPVVERCGCKSKEELLKYANVQIKKGERYVLNYIWVEKDAKGNEKLYAHVLHLFKDSDGVVKVYDGQTNRFSSLKYFHDLQNMLFEYEYKGELHDASPRLLRIDNLGFNLKFARKILSRKTRRK